MGVIAPHKHRLLRATLVLVMLACASCAVWQWISKPAVELQVMSFNIRQGHGNDGEDRWELRKDLVAEVIRDAAPDIACLQEVYPFQLEYLLGQLTGYAAVGTGRDGGSQGEHCPLVFRGDRFGLIASETVWLSDTPATPSASSPVPGSRPSWPLQNTRSPLVIAWL